MPNANFALRNTCAVRIRLLMTRGAVETWHTFSSGATHDIEQMPVPVISLLWVVRCSMAINAARMRQYGVDFPPRGETSFAGYLKRHTLLSNRLPHCART